MTPAEAPETDIGQRTQLLSKLRHDLKTPLNQIIGYSEMLLEDAEAAGHDSTAQKLRSVLESARSSLAVQSRSLNRAPEEIRPAVWTEFSAAQQAQTGRMDELLTELGREKEAAGIASDLDRLRQAVGNLRDLTDEAPAIWDGAVSTVPEQPARPVFSVPVEAASEPVSPAAGPSLGNLLLVDDSPTNLSVLSKRLIREGYTVTLAVNGRDALEQMERASFDLILLDIVMPELDGIAVLQRVRSNPKWKDTPVIMISALDEISSVVRCIEMGAEDYLPKPFDPVLLRARIGSLLERKRLRDEEHLRAARLEEAFQEAELQKQSAERTLRNILPAKVAAELNERGTVEPMYFEDVTIGFTDFVGFTLATERLAAEELVGLLHDYFTAFDRIVSRYGLEKMKTIGDSYMFASGLPERRPSHPVDAVLAALEIVDTVKNMARPVDGIDWKIRVGLHTGPVIAGVVGIHKFAFDIWGDSVNFASRMESSGEANRVNVSERTYARIKDFIACTPRGRVKTKDGREVDMFFAEGPHEKLMDDRTIGPPPTFARRYRIYFQKQPKAFPEFLLQPGEAQPA